MTQKVDTAGPAESFRLREILEQSPVGVSIIKRDRFERLFINSRMIELLGIAGREHTPGIDTFVREADYHWVMEQLAAGAVVDAAEFERRRVDDGRIWWSSMHARPTVFEGREAGIIWLYDISTIKRLEQKFRLLATTQSDWIWELDKNLRVIAFSDNFYEQTGFTPSQIEGLGMEEWGRMSRATPESYARFLHCVTTRQPVRDLVFEREDSHGRKWVRLNATPVWEGETFMGYLGSTTDITELRQAQNRLVETERAAALGGLVAGVAHEINTPLGVNVTAVSVLERDVSILRKAYADGTMTRESLERFLNSCGEATKILGENLRRAAGLVRNFKQVAVDQTSDQPRMVNLRDYVEQVIKTLSPRISKSRHKVVVAGDADIEIESFPGAIAQIVTNLIENALIHGFRDRNAPGTIEIRIDRSGGTIHLSCRDDGVGMTPEIANRAFEPFFTTSRGQGGSGLGLSIVRNLVAQRLGGTIDCRTAPGRGTTIEIAIPETLST
jgi:PAS domain S-box-containing protein